jgi:hypothetical protein
VGSSSAIREERRAALLMLQRLLADAETSLSTGGRGSETALEHVAEAFELFRSRQEREGDPATPTPEVETRRMSLRTLAQLLGEMDQSIARGDPKSIEAALEKTREALEIARRLDETHSSGIRRMYPSKPDK